MNSSWLCHFVAALVAPLALALVPAPAAAPPATSRPAGLHLVPWPKSVTVSQGRLVLTDKSHIVATSAELLPLAHILADEVFLATGLRLATPDRIGKGGPGDVVLKIDPDLKADDEILSVRRGAVKKTRDGAHRLTVTDRASVEGFDHRAVAEGTATLLQALRKVGDDVVLPKLTIRDWPHADFAAAMIDVGRQYNSLDDLRRCVRTCRLYKVRYLHLHLTDDQGWTFPSTSLPKLGTKNGAAHGGVPPRRYDLDGLKELVRFADERGVTLVPEIEMPGHSGAARRAMPEVFGCVDAKSNKVQDVGMMNLANPKLYEALDTLVGEVTAVFRSSPFVHVGGDEVSGLAALLARDETKAFMKEKELKDGGELIHHFIREVEKMVRKRGKRTIVWEGIAQEASRDLIVMTWDGNSRTAERLIAKGYTTITCPWNLGVPLPRWSMYVCNGSFLKRGDSVLGAIVPAWEQGGETALRMLRAGAPQRQERTWGPDNFFTEDDLAKRTATTDALLDRLLCGFAPQHDGEVQIVSERGTFCRITRPTSLRLDSSIDGGRIRLTRDGSEPGAKSPAYDGPVRIDDDGTITARLFDRDGKPLASPWSMRYRFEPLSISSQGTLKDKGKDSPWFAKTMTLTLRSTMKAGRIRYTLDGSEPKPDSMKYESPIEVTKTARLRARWFDADDRGRGGVLSADYFRLPSVRHAATGKKVTIVSPKDYSTDPRNAGRKAEQLVDGYLARGDVWHSPEALHFADRDLEVIIDLGESTAINRLGGHFLHSQESGVFPPVRLDFWTSDDGKDYKKVASVTYEIPKNPESRGYFSKTLAADVRDVKGRYVKMVAKNAGLIPNWHPVAGRPGHLFVDELFVNPSE